MKHFIYICLLFIIAACSDDEKLTNRIDFSLPYVIEDDPNDPIQHKRYELYKQYNVPVYFNDTIQVKNIGNDFAGNPIYRYETLDLNWDFDSDTHQTLSYRYDYLLDKGKQTKGLEFAETFLQQCSPKMRPFSLFLVDTVFVTNMDEELVTTPEYVSGVRVLALAQFQNYEQGQMVSASKDILRSICKSRITQDKNFVARFGSISSKNHYYGKTWQELGCSQSTLDLFDEDWMWGPNNLYNENQIKKLMDTYQLSPEEFEELRSQIFTDIGTFGFISGWKNSSGKQSPTDVDEDLDTYINTLLDIGEEEFQKRYCASPMVSEKYTLLHNFITDELGVEL